MTKFNRTREEKEKGANLILYTILTVNAGVTSLYVFDVRGRNHDFGAKERSKKH